MARLRHCSNFHPMLRGGPPRSWVPMLDLRASYGPASLGGKTELDDFPPNCRDCLGVVPSRVPSPLKSTPSGGIRPSAQGVVKGNDGHPWLSIRRFCHLSDPRKFPDCLSWGGNRD